MNDENSFKGVRMRRIILGAVGIAGLMLLAFGAVALGQTDPALTVIEPGVGLLASAAGLSVVIAVVMNLIRNLFPSPELFNRWAPLAATGLGVLGSFAYVLTTGDPVNGESLLGAFLIGIFAGGYSQNINTVLTRTTTQANELVEE